MQSFSEYLDRARRKHGSQFDPSDLDRRFVPYFENEQRISVKWRGLEPPIRGTVGVTTGWKPVFLLMLTRRSRGSSWTLGRQDQIVQHVPKRRLKKPRMLFNMRKSNGNPGCVACHGDLVFLGGLGNLKWFRCRACGMEQSRKAKRRVKRNPFEFALGRERIKSELSKRGATRKEIAEAILRLEGLTVKAPGPHYLSDFIWDQLLTIRMKMAGRNPYAAVGSMVKGQIDGSAWYRTRRRAKDHADMMKSAGWKVGVTHLKNPIESTPGGGFVVTGKATQLYRLIALKHAMKLELTTGMKMSRGISPFAIVKQEFGFKGNKQKVYDQLVKYIEQVGPGLAQNPGREFVGVKYWKVWSWIKQYGRWQFIAKVRATYPEIKRHFPGARVSRLDMLVGEVRVMKKSQVKVPAKVRA